MVVIALNTLLVVGTLVLIAVCRASVACRHRFTIVKDNEKTLVSLLVFLLAVSILVSVSGHLSRGPAMFYKLSVVSLVFLFVVRQVKWIFRRDRVRFVSDWRELVDDMKEVFIPTLIATYVLSPAYLHLSQAGTTYGPATLFNGDIANYALVAENVLKTGFANSQHILNADYGLFARSNSYTTATGVINFLSIFGGKSSYQVLLPAMAISIGFLYLSLKFLVNSFSVPSKHVVTCLVSFGVLNSLTVHSIGQYYISAVLCTASVAVVVGCIVRMQRTSDIASSRGIGMILAAATSLAIYSYGHIGLVLVVATPLVTFILEIVQSQELSIHQRVRRSSSRFAVSALWCLIALAVSTPALQSAVNLLRAQAGADVGYGLRDLNPLGILLFPAWIKPVWVQGDLSPIWDLTTWTVLLILIIVACGYARHASRLRILLPLILGISILFASAVLLFGTGSYQAWKLWSLLVPIGVIVVGVIVVIATTTKPIATTFMCALLFGIGLTTPWAVWDEKIWSPSSGTVLTRELETSARRLERLDIGQININLGDYLETMMAGSIISKSQIAFNSKSYLGQPLDIKSTCTLTRSDLVPAGVDVRPLVLPYVIAFYPTSCDRSP